MSNAHIPITNRGYEIISPSALVEAEGIPRDELQAKEYQEGSGVYILNPYHESKDKCDQPQHDSSVFAIKLGKEPKELHVIGFGLDDLPNTCDDYSKDCVEGFIQHDFKCAPGFGDKLWRNGKDLLLVTPKNNWITLPKADEEYVFFNRTNKRLLVTIRDTMNRNATNYTTGTYNN